MKRKLESPPETIAEQIDSVFKDLYEKEASLSIAGMVKELFWGKTLSFEEISHCEKQVKQFKEDCMDVAYDMDLNVSMLLIHANSVSKWMSQLDLFAFHIRQLLATEITTFDWIRLLVQEYKFLLESMLQIIVKLKTCLHVDLLHELKQHIMTLKRETSRKKLF